MNTKTILLSIALAAISFESYSASPTTTAGTSASESVVVVTVPRKSTGTTIPSTRPRGGDAEFLDAVYVPTEDMLLFSSDCIEAGMKVDIISLTSGEEYIDYISNTQPYMNVTLKPSNYIITCTSCFGSVYESEFEIQ
jgi:hypothetical protein